MHDCLVVLFCSVQELAEDWAKTLEQIVDWSALGCDKTAADSTVWLGTEGSHTPLHYDTYGVNLVRCCAFSFPWCTAVGRLTDTTERLSILGRARFARSNHSLYVRDFAQEISRKMIRDGKVSEEPCLNKRGATRTTRWPNCMAKNDGCSTPPLTRRSSLPPGCRTKRAVSSVMSTREHQTLAGVL